MRFILSLFVLFIFVSDCFAQVHVKGYTRKDGTYVAPHIRSSPDAHKWNNYGPSSSSTLYTGKGSVTPPSTRDSDRDGIANLYDYDDNNNGVLDDLDSYQYSQGFGITRGLSPNVNAIEALTPTSRPIISNSLKQNYSASSGLTNLELCKKPDHLSILTCDPTQLSKASLADMTAEQLQRVKLSCRPIFSGLSQSSRCNFSLLPIDPQQREKLVKLERTQNLEICLKSKHSSFLRCDPTQLSDASFSNMTVEQLQGVKRSCSHNFGGFIQTNQCDFNSLPIDPQQRVKLVELEQKQNLEFCRNSTPLSMMQCDPTQLSEVSLAEMEIEQLQRIKQNCNRNFGGFNLAKQCNFSSLPVGQRQMARLAKLEQEQVELKRKQRLQLCSNTDQMSQILCRHSKQ